MTQLLTDTRQYRDAIRTACMYQYHRNEPHWKEVYEIASNLLAKYGSDALARIETIAVMHI